MQHEYGTLISALAHLQSDDFTRHGWHKMANFSLCYVVVRAWVLGFPAISYFATLNFRQKSTEEGERCFLLDHKKKEKIASVRVGVPGVLASQIFTARNIQYGGSNAGGHGTSLVVSSHCRYGVGIPLGRSHPRRHWYGTHAALPWTNL